MKYVKFFFIALPAISLLVYPVVTLAQGPVRCLRARRTEQPPVIDGCLDDPCWEAAHSTTGFTDYRSEEKASEQTIVRVLYDDENIYVAFECIEPHPEQIIAVERKYDQSLQDEDRVEVRFDTFRDRRRAYIFTVNTLGTRYDARIGLFDYDDSWGCEWFAAAEVGENRWFAEMAIPIGNMLFQRKNNVEWGVNFRRVEKSKQESSYWYFPHSQASSPQHYGVLTNLDLAGAEVDCEPAFETYVSGNADLHQSSNTFSTGVDVSMRLNSNYVSAFTINPDFGQVEADPDTIELRDTERFLKERRTFFREGSELFETPMNIYYSRRLTDIQAGAKVTGQSRKWAMGMVNVRGDIQREGLQPRGNFNVGRMIYNVGDSSHVGGIWADSRRSGGSNTSGGLDSRLYLNETMSVTAQMLGLRDSNGIEPDGKVDRDGHGLYTSLGGGTQPFWYRFHYRDISRGFKPDLGYIPRRDIRGPGSYLQYRKNLADSFVRWYSVTSDIDYYRDGKNNTKLRDFEERAGVCFQNEIELWYARGDNFHAPFENRYDQFKLEYNEERDMWDSFSVGFERGVYETEPYHEYFLDKPSRITDRLVTTVTGNFRVKDQRAGGDENIWLWRSVTQYSFVWNARIKLTLEQTSEDRHNVTVLFSWPVKRTTDFYVLFNDYGSAEEDVRAVFVKLVYRF